MKIKGLLSITITAFILCFSTFAFAQTDNDYVGKTYEMTFEEGFSIELPQEFQFSETPIEKQFVNFSAQRIYEYTGDYERIRVLIGQDENINSVFEQYFENCQKRDLDLSVFTNKQLIEHTDYLNSYIDDTFPVYMNFTSSKSETFDSRLSLISTAYYVDEQNDATGMVKAYEFYYMDNSIIFYYDTLIDGTHYIDQTFNHFDSIMSTLEFEIAPSSRLKNPTFIGHIFSSIYRPILAAILGGLLGFIIAYLSKIIKKSEKTTSNDILQDVKTATKDIEDIIDDTETMVADIEQNDQKDIIRENDVMRDENILDPVYQESIDWNMLLDEVKSEPLQQKQTVESQEISEELTDIDAPAKKVVVSKRTKQPKRNTIKANIFKQKSNQIIEDSNTEEIIEELDNKASTSDNVTLTSLEDSPLEQSSLEQPSNESPFDDVEVEDVALKNSETSSDNSSLDEVEIEDIALNNLSKSEKKNMANNINELMDEYGETVDLHEAYLNKILPKRKLNAEKKKHIVKPAKIVVDKDSHLSVQGASDVDLVKLQDEIFSFLKQEKPKEQDKQDHKEQPKENHVKLGPISRFLNSIVNKIEKDDNHVIDELEGVESRKQLHRKEKVERNKIEELIPGLLEDDDGDAEVLNIMIDETLDVDHMEKNKDK